MNDLIRMDEQAVGEVLHAMMMPIVEPLAIMLKQSTEAIERLSATQSIMAKQIEALEKQVRMNTPVTSVQTRYLNNAIRDKAAETIERFGRSDKAARDALARRIRRDILIRSGISSMRELPKCEYEVALKQISTWNNAIVIRDIVRNIQKEEQHEQTSE